MLININGKLYHLIHSEFKWNNISDYSTEMNISNCVFWHMNIQNKKSTPPLLKLDSNGRSHIILMYGKPRMSEAWFMCVSKPNNICFTTLKIHTKRMFTLKIHTNWMFTLQIPTNRRFTLKIHTNRMFTLKIHTNRMFTLKIHVNRMFTLKIYNNQIFTL